MTSTELRDLAVIFDAAIQSDNPAVIRALDHLINVTKLAHTEYNYGLFEQLIDDRDDLRKAMKYSTITPLMNTKYGLN